MTLQADRKLFFQLAHEADAVQDLAKIADVVGRFQSAKITLNDGRTASYTIPSNVKLPPIERKVPTPSSYTKALSQIKTKNR